MKKSPDFFEGVALPSPSGPQSGSRNYSDPGRFIARTLLRRWPALDQSLFQ